MRAIALLFTLLASPAFASYQIPDGGVVNSKVGFNVKNYAQNSEFRYWQRQVPATLTSRQDAAYGPDRMYYLTSGGAVNVQGARVAEDITASRNQYIGQFRQADGSARQFGVAQYLETGRVIPLRGHKATLSFYARTDGTEITTIRACILQWAGTADSPTKDVVSSWSSTPTWISDVTCANTPADITISSSWSKTTITATLSTTFNNLGWFIWTPNTEAQNDDFYLAQIQLVDGNSSVPWPLTRLEPGPDLEECKRFYQKSYLLDVAPGTDTDPGAIQFTHQALTSSGYVEMAHYFITTMFKVPSMAMWDADGTANRIKLDNGTYASAGVGSNTPHSWYVSYTNTAGRYGNLFQWTADAEF